MDITVATIVEAIKAEDYETALKLVTALLAVPVADPNSQVPAMWQHITILYRLGRLGEALEAAQKCLIACGNGPIDVDQAATIMWQVRILRDLGIDVAADALNHNLHERIATEPTPLVAWQIRAMIGKRMARI